MQSTLQKFNSSFYSLATQACCAWSWCTSWPKEINDEVAHIKKKRVDTHISPGQVSGDLGQLFRPWSHQHAFSPSHSDWWATGYFAALSTPSNLSPLLGRPPILPIRGKTWLLVFYHLLKIALVLKLFYWNSLLVKHVVNIMRTFGWFFAGLLCVVNGFRQGNFSNKLTCSLTLKTCQFQLKMGLSFERKRS